jgi:hypothetical protein
MSVRSGRLALLLVLAAPASALAQGFSYAPGTGQYRITSSMKGAQEVMGQRQEMESSSNQLVTIAVARGGKDTLNLTTTLDSIQITGPMGMTPPGLDKLAGTKVTAKISPTGQVYSANGPSADSLPNAEQLVEEMSNVLPKVRASMKAGATWTDTVTRKGSQGGLEIERKIVASYAVAGDTTIGGQKAWKITRKAVTTMTGSGAQNGQPMTLEGTSNGSGTMVVTPAGSFLGYTNEEDVNLKVLIVANGMEVGVTQTAVTKVEKVR